MQTTLAADTLTDDNVQKQSTTNKPVPTVKQKQRSLKPSHKIHQDNFKAIWTRKVY